MKKIKKRRRFFRINSPVTFGILCGVILLAIGGAAFGLAAGVISPAISQARTAAAAPTLPPEATDPAVIDATGAETGAVEAPEETATPEPTEAPTPTPEPETEATPEPASEDQGAVGRLTGHVIAIDAAKGKGAKYKGVSSKTPEYKTNLNVANLVKEILEDEGATVVMTRTDDTFIKNNKRYKTVNASSAELCVTIMCNYVDSGSVRGTYMIIPSTKANKTANGNLAKAILSAYTSATDMPIRSIGTDGVRTSGDWETLNGMKVPCCAIILGHISNKTDDANLNDTTFLARAAQGIANGIINYLK